jgi:phage terminase large subunit
VTAAALTWPGSTSIVFRRTKDEVKDNHVNPFRVELPDKLPNGRRLYSFNGQDLCAHFVNGSRIYFAYLRYEEDRMRYQGNQYDVMVFEESTHYEFENVRWLTGNRLRATVDGARPFCVYPSNPGGVGHAWYRRLFIDRTYDPDADEFAEDYAFVQARVQDNRVLLERDPRYIRQLNSLPEPYRSWLRDGDWDVGMGLALAASLDRSKHIVHSFEPPDHWPKFGALDWGYDHPFSFGVYTVSEDGWVFKLDTVTGRRLLPHEIGERITHELAGLGLTLGDLKYIVAGLDLFDERRARGESTPSLFEQFCNYDWRFSRMRRASVSRIFGLNNMRDYLKWKGIGEDGEDGEPALYFMRTKGNLACFKQLEDLPADPKNNEDALKSDADVFGTGGDDMYDETRYAVASRPPRAQSTGLDYQPRAWDPAVLQHEADEGRRVRSRDRTRDQELDALGAWMP